MTVSVFHVYRVDIKNGLSEVLVTRAANECFTMLLNLLDM